jgi:hypothetical protein
MRIFIKFRPLCSVSDLNMLKRHFKAPRSSEKLFCDKVIAEGGEVGFRGDYGKIIYLSSFYSNVLNDTFTSRF